MTGIIVALVSCPPDKAAGIAEALVEGRFAACVNIVPGVRSVYRWQGAVQRDDEALLVIKTAADRFEELKRAVLEMHPYELPEVIALPVAHGHVPYLEWVVQSAR
jgi:periplasmic divalent cation tolerance protein